MDTLNHVLMGSSVAIIAVNSESMQSKPELIGLTFTVCIIASLYPDFDVITKIKNNATYMRQHRGISHSIIIVTLCAYLFNSLINFLASYLYPSYINDLLLPFIFTGAYLHIFTDIFNNYGTKVLWPFKDTWYAIGATNTIDTIILSIQLSGLIIAFFFTSNRLLVAYLIFILIAIYLLCATLILLYNRHVVYKNIDNLRKVVITSKSMIHQWKFVAETQDKIYIIGTIHGGSIEILDEIKKEEKFPSGIWKIIKKDPNVEIFLKFSKVYNWELKETNDIISIKLFDLRYLTKIQGEYNYIFNTAIIIDKHTMNIDKSYMGFVKDEKTLYKMLAKQ